MLANTGTISFFLYGILILISIIAMVIVFKIIKNDTIPAEKLDKMIELFKYTIITTSMATVTLIVTDLFKEREQDLRELDYFDKYVDDVKVVNGVERLQLSKYLSIVAPSGEIKKSWRNYYDSISEEYKIYQENLDKKRISDTIKFPNEKQLIEQEKIQEKIDQFEKPLIQSTDKKLDEWYIVTGTDVSIEDANNELRKAIKVNPNAKIIKKGNYYQTILPGYFDKKEALKIKETAVKELNKSSYIIKK